MGLVRLILNVHIGLVLLDALAYLFPHWATYSFFGQIRKYVDSLRRPIRKLFSPYLKNRDRSHLILIVLLYLLTFCKFLLPYFMLMVIVDTLLSYFPDMKNNKIAKFNHKCCEIIVGPIRSNLPTNQGPFDFSPLVALIVLQFAKFIW